jgi:hypothetical protein
MIKGFEWFGLTRQSDSVARLVAPTRAAGLQAFVEKVNQPVDAFTWMYVPRVVAIGKK